MYEVLFHFFALLLLSGGVSLGAHCIHPVYRRFVRDVISSVPRAVLWLVLFCRVIRGLFEAERLVPLAK